MAINEKDRVVKITKAFYNEQRGKRVGNTVAWDDLSDFDKLYLSDSMWSLLDAFEACSAIVDGKICNKREDEHASHRFKPPEEILLLSRVQRVVGTIPVGTIDLTGLIDVLAHPDVISYTKAYLKAKE